MSARTRFSDLSYRCDAPGLWRIVATDTDSSIGPYYASKAELLSDLERYAKESGCPEAGVSEYISPDAVFHTLRADNARLREALALLVSWFRLEPGAMSAREHLMCGCPNDLAAAVEKARSALAPVGGGE